MYRGIPTQKSCAPHGWMLVSQLWQPAMRAIMSSSMWQIH